MKHNLLRKLLMVSPIVIAPLMANSCNGEGAGSKAWSNLTPSTKVPKKATLIKPSTSTVSKYVTALATSLKIQLDSTALKAAVTDASTKTANTVDITTYITQAITTAKATVKKAGLMEKYIDQIKLVFANTGNLAVKVTSSTYMLIVYPAFVTGTASTSTLDTTLSLTFTSGSDSQKITNNYDVAKGFKTFTEGLGSTLVNSVYATADGNTIYAATNYGITVGTKGSGGNYAFAENYTTDNGLGSNIVNSITVIGTTIYAATGEDPSEGGVSVGTKQPDGTYIFVNNVEGLAAYSIVGMAVSSDGNTIYAASEAGVSVGTKQPDGSYDFTPQNTDLANTYVRDVYASSDGNTIYAATDGGVSVGTKGSGGNYAFAENYTTDNGLGSNIVNSVYASSGGKTIYAATNDGLSIKGDRNFFNNFKNNPPFGSSVINSINVSTAGTIYAATNDGVVIGTYDDNNEEVSMSNFTAGLGSKVVERINVSSNGNNIYVATNDGVAISKTSWASSTNNFTSPKITNFRQD